MWSTHTLAAESPTSATGGNNQPALAANLAFSPPTGSVIVHESLRHATSKTAHALEYFNMAAFIPID